MFFCSVMGETSELTSLGSDAPIEFQVGRRNWSASETQPTTVRYLMRLSLEKRSCLVAPAGIDGNQFPSLSAKATELLLVPVVFHNFIFPDGSPVALNKRG